MDTTDNKPVMMDRIFEALKAKQQEFPGLRMGQLIANCIPPDKAIFYLSDEAFLNAIWRFKPSESECKYM